MRRRPGISGLQKGAQAKDVFKTFGDNVNQTKLEHMKAQMAAFKDNLSKFAIKHRDDVRRDPVFRAQFHTMCANVGVDPLASNKGMWAQLLHFGDFYYELGVQIVEACLASRAMNGGLIDLDLLRAHVTRRRGPNADPISEDDILRAIGKLKALGSGFQVIKVGNQRLVRSVPGELNTDKSILLELAQSNGCVSHQQIEQSLKWGQTRRDETLQAMLKEELAMIDDQGPYKQRLYWFPCLADFSAPSSSTTTLVSAA